MSHRVAVDDLVARLTAGDEHAVLDPREQGSFSTSHLLHAVSVPLSRLEVLLGELVPRRATPVTWCDDASTDLAERAARRTEELGWNDVAVLDGGTQAWAAAGRELYSGVNVASKLFGELVERHYGTPHISAADLAARQAAGLPTLVLDSRTEREFHNMSIPAGRSCPGGELVHRIYEVVPDDDVLVVVNCAGRTRSILGAQSLRNAGLPNPVVALENGTMGWELAGLELDRGRSDAVPPPSSEARVAARAASRSVATRFGIESIDAPGLVRWLADGERTTFVLDVRTPDEFAAGHLPGSRSAPGGQLVQATDEYVGTRNARVVLVDDDEVRATMAASWLAQMGWPHVRTHTAAGADRLVETGPHAGPAPPDVPMIEPAGVDAAAAIVDLSPSRHHRTAHPRGAWWAIRSRLDEAARMIGPTDALVLTSTDDVLVRFAHADAVATWPGSDVRVLDGGTAAWAAAGLPTGDGMPRPTTDVDDVWAKPYDPENEEIVRARMHEYLTWEVGLLEQHARDDLAVFRLPPT